MERIDLPESTIKSRSPPGSPKESMAIQSLLHAESNKDKIRSDVHDVDFMRSINNSSRKKASDMPQISPKHTPSPVNIFNHLKRLSETFEKEDRSPKNSLPSEKATL